MKKSLLLISLLLISLLLGCLFLTGCNETPEDTKPPVVNPPVENKITLEEIIPYINGEKYNYESKSVLEFNVDGIKLEQIVETKHLDNLEYSKETAKSTDADGNTATAITETYIVYGDDKDTIYTKVMGGSWVETENTEEPGLSTMFDFTVNSFELKGDVYKLTSAASAGLGLNITVDLEEGTFTIASFAHTVVVSNIGNDELVLPF